MLKFIQHDQMFEGQPYVIMKFSGISPSMSTATSAEDFEELKKFSVKTYAAFVERRTTDAAYIPVNQFLKTLPISSQEKIADLFLAINALIKANTTPHRQTTKSDDVDELVTNVAELIVDVDTDTELCKQLDLFVSSGHVSVADMSNAGSRVIDRRDMTFTQPEAESLTSVAMLCKLFSPIFGEFMKQYAVYVDKRYRESYAIAMLTPLLKKNYTKLMQKTEHYARSLTINKCRSDPTTRLRMSTPESAARNCLSVILVKKYPPLDLNRPDGNIIKFTASQLSSLNQNRSDACDVIMIEDPNDTAATDETNSSRIESELNHTPRPIDNLPISLVGASWVIEETIRTENLKDYGIEDTLGWYKAHPMVITPIGQYLVSSYFGPAMHGGVAIYYLDAPTTIKLIAVLQTLFAKSKMYYLANGLTIVPSSEDRIVQADDFVFMTAWKSSKEYSLCKKAIPAGFGTTSWDETLKHIEVLITTKTMIYHTAPTVWDILGTQPMNNKVFGVHEYLPLMQEVMRLINVLYLERSRA